MSYGLKKPVRVVCACVVNQGEILCVKKGSTRFDYTSFRWEFPGGKIETGELPSQALKRELLEEMDYRVTVARHLITVDHEYADFKIKLEAYLCRASSRDFVLKEHTDFRWLPASRLGELHWCGADLPIAQLLMDSNPEQLF